MSETEELLAALIAVRDAGGNASHGICCSIATKVRDLTSSWKILDKLIAKWPKHSGYIQYPIKGGAIAYCEAKNCAKLWDRSTEYGALRWELLEWLIEELQQ